jgi:GC-rich sequence DNA-binding factor
VVSALLGDLLVYVPAEDERMLELLRLVKESLQEAVEAAAVPHWPPAATAAWPQADAVAAVAFKRALQLLQGLCSFEGLLARSWLQPLALGALLQGQLLPHLRSATGDLPTAVARAEAVVSCLCLEWFNLGAPAGAAGLLEFMSTVAMLLEGQRSNDSSGLSNQLKRGLVQRLAECMQKLGDEAGRKRLLHAYGIRE